MNVNEKRILILMIVGALVLIPAASGLGNIRLEIDEARWEADQTNPAISGQLVACQAASQEDTDLILTMIFSPGNIECYLPFGGGYQSYPAVSGALPEMRVVWMDDQNGNSDIREGPFPGGPDSPFITTDPADQRWPDVSGDRIVWQDSRNGNADIYMYDLSTGIETPICVDPGEQHYPKIDGNRVVWMGASAGTYDIYMYDLSTGVTRKITNDNPTQTNPAISGDYIVWEDYRNGNDELGYLNNGDIYLYDLRTGVERRITTDPADQLWPAISGNRIVWEDSRNGNADIYMYDLELGIEVQATSDPGNQQDPDISGDYVVWEDDRNGDWDIYMADLSEDYIPPTIASTIPATGATGVSVNTGIGGTWSESVTEDRPEFAVSAGKMIFPCITMWDGDSFSLKPIDPLPENTVITVGAWGAKDLAGNLQSPNPYTWSFTTAGNHLPEARFVAIPTRGLASLAVTFDASTSSDPDGTIASYEWTFGDGSAGKGTTASHTYTAAGSYTATLTVTDNDGAADTETVTIDVITVAVATRDLKLHVVAVGLPIDIQTGLTDKLDATVAALNRNLRKTAVNNLNSFNLQVKAQTGRTMTAAQAEALIAEAKRIIAAV